MKRGLLFSAQTDYIYIFPTSHPLTDLVYVIFPLSDSEAHISTCTRGKEPDRCHVETENIKKGNRTSAHSPSLRDVNLGNSMVVLLGLSPVLVKLVMRLFRVALVRA